MAVVDIAQPFLNLSAAAGKSYNHPDVSSATAAGDATTGVPAANTRSSSRCSLDSGFESCSFPASPDSSCSSAKLSGMRPTDFRHIAAEFSDEPALKMPKLEAEVEVSDKLTEQIHTPEPCPDITALSRAASSCCGESVGPSTSASLLSVIDCCVGRGQQYICEWMECEDKFANDNELFDHVVQKHIEPIRPSLKKPAAGALGRAARLAGRRGSGSGSKGEKYKCLWSECEMCMTVGDEQKQFDWLLNHYTTRHAPKAQPFKCLFAECSLRFRLQRSLNDHLRSAHDEKNNKRHREEKKAVAPSSCYAIKPRSSMPLNRGVDCIDPRTMDWVRSRLQQFDAMKQPRFQQLPMDSAAIGSHLSGAQRRKRGLPRFAIYDLVDAAATSATAASPARNDSDAENSAVDGVRVKQEMESPAKAPLRKRAAQECSY